MNRFKGHERKEQWTTIQAYRTQNGNANIMSCLCQSSGAGIFAHIGKELGRLFVDLARQKECRIESGSIQPDHVHMLINIPPKHSVAQVIGYIKGKSAIYIARTYGKKMRNFLGEHFWARGYLVSTVGKDEATIREYIRHQEEEDKRLDQLNLLP